MVNLLIAAQNGDMLLLFRYYEMGINFSLGDYDSTTALHLACSFGQVKVVRFLLNNCDVSQMKLCNHGNHGNHGNRAVTMVTTVTMVTMVTVVTVL